MIDLDHLEALARAASPGLWTCSEAAQVANPAAVLGLCAEVRELRRQRAALVTELLCDEGDLPSYSKAPLIERYPNWRDWAEECEP